MKKIKGEYESAVHLFYKNEYKYVNYIAKKIKSIHYSIPIESDDLVSYCFLKLFESETKLEYFTNKIYKKENVNDFIKRKIWTFMYNYCNKYKSRNHRILNDIVAQSFNEEILENISENYYYDENFPYLTKFEFEIIYEIYVNNTKRVQLYKKMNISKFKLKQIEDIALNKIYKSQKIKK